MRLDELAKQQNIQPSTERSFGEFARVYARLERLTPREGFEPESELEGKVKFIKSRIQLAALTHLGLWQKKLPFDTVMTFGKGAHDAFKALSASYQERTRVDYSERQRSMSNSRYDLEARMIRLQFDGLISPLEMQPQGWSDKNASYCVGQALKVVSEERKQDDFLSHFGMLKKQPVDVSHQYVQHFQREAKREYVRAIKSLAKAAIPAGIIGAIAYGANALTLSGDTVKETIELWFQQFPGVVSTAGAIALASATGLSLFMKQAYGHLCAGMKSRKLAYYQSRLTEECRKEAEQFTDEDRDELLAQLENG